MRPSSARSAPGRPGAPTSRDASASRSTPTRWAWVSASPTSRRPQSASRPPIRGSSAIACSDGADDVLVAAHALDDRLDQGPGVGVDVGRDLPVEVLRDPVPDVGLDQALEPVVRCGPLVERVDGHDERRDRLLRVGPELLQPRDDLFVVEELGDGEASDLGLVADARRRLGVRRELAEGAQLAVGQRAQQVDDRGAEVVGPRVGGVRGRRRQRWGPSCAHRSGGGMRVAGHRPTLGGVPAARSDPPRPPRVAEPEAHRHREWAESFGTRPGALPPDPTALPRRVASATSSTSCPGRDVLDVGVGTGHRRPPAPDRRLPCARRRRRRPDGRVGAAPRGRGRGRPVRDLGPRRSDLRRGRRRPDLALGGPGRGHREGGRGAPPTRAAGGVLERR